MRFLSKLALAVCIAANFSPALVAQINAGPDLFICQGNTVTLNAVATGGYGTDSYSFEVFPYQPETYTGGTPVTFGGNQDDQIAGPFQLGFQFCFFNTYYNQFYIGSNGWVGFSYSSSWTTYTSQAIPSTSSAVPKNCIMAPWQDWHPGVSSSYGPPYVFYKTVGTAPNRKLVVYWKSCPMYSCTTTYATFQIVLNEQSSIVENHLTNKPNCTSWAGGTATQGVHNSNGTIAFTAPGRNSTQWVVTNESTRFVPSGIKWYTGGYPNGTVVGYGPELVVTPAVTTTYTAVVNLCGGQVFTDDVVVSVTPQDNAAFSYGSSTLCQSGFSGLPVTTFPGGSYTATPSGLSINPTTGNINLGASVAGSYTITHITTGTCPDTASITVSVVLSPSAIFGYPLPAYCTTALNPIPIFPFGSTAGTFTSSPTGLVFANLLTGEINLSATSPGVYNVTNTIPPSAACPQVSYTTTVEILNLPAPASMPQGATSLCENPANTQYSTTPLANTTSYTWTLAPPAAGTLQSNGPNALVNWSDNFIGNAGIAVSGTNACGNGTNSLPLIIHINPLPKETGTPEGSTSHCQGPGMTGYETSGSAYADSYEWLLTPTAAGFIFGNGQAISVSWSAFFSGTAQLSVRGVNDCGTSVWSLPLSILVAPLPSAPSQPQGPVLFCSGGASADYATGITANATSYQWVLTPDNAGVVNGNSNSVIVNWAPLFSGPVELKVVAVNDCGSSPFSPVLDILIAPNPQVNAGNDTTVTTNATIILKGAVTGSQQNMLYHWEPAALCENPDVLRPLTLPLVNSTLFTFTATNSETGCTATDEVMVEVAGAPLTAVISGNPLSICNGATAQLSAQAYGGAGSNYQYTWYQNGVMFSNQQNLIVNPASTTIYAVEVFDGNSTYSGSITIEVWPLPFADAGADLQIPFFTQTQLSGNANPPGSYSYQWQPADYLTNSNVQNPLTLPLIYSIVFSLTVIDQHGCVSLSDEMTVMVDGGGLTANPLAIPDTLCKGESSTLYALPTGGVTAGYTYRWLKGSEFFSDQPTLIVTPEATTVYNLEVGDGFATIYRNVTITVNALPDVNLIGPEVHHEGNTILSCVYDTVTIPLQNPRCRYLWSDGSTGNSIDLWTSGLSFDFREIWVEVTDTVSGCLTRKEVNVMFNFISCSYGVDDLSGANKILVYPNPAGNKVRIKPTGEASGSCLIQLIGIRGEVLNEVNGNWTPDGIELNIRNRADGLYLLRVITGNEISLVKLMISKTAQ